MNCESNVTCSSFFFFCIFTTVSKYVCVCVCACVKFACKANLSLFYHSSRREREPLLLIGIVPGSSRLLRKSGLVPCTCATHSHSDRCIRVGFFRLILNFIASFLHTVSNT
jgi:hypothetical protein